MYINYTSIKKKKREILWVRNTGKILPLSKNKTKDHLKKKINGGNLAQTKKKIWQSWLFSQLLGGTGAAASMAPAVLGAKWCPHPRNWQL